MNNHQIYITAGTDYTGMTKKLLSRASLDALIGDRNKEIGIKPNLVSPSDASYGATTHPEIVAGIIEYLQERGFCHIRIMEGSWVGARTKDVYSLCGYDSLCEKYRVPFCDMQKDKGIRKDCAGMELSVCKSVYDIDFLINVPVLKGHCQTRITCALKNMKGLIPNSEKRRFHALGLHKPIAHLNTAIRQDFIVVDNICGDLDYEDGGHPYVMNRILCGRDPVLIDSYVCHLLHYETKEVPYITEAASLGVGCCDLRKADIRLIDKEQALSGNAADMQGSAAAGETDLTVPRSRKVVELADHVQEVDSCSACYGTLIPALERLEEEGLLKELDDRICIGQGFRGKKGSLGIGHCTAGFSRHLEGCPPDEEQIYAFLKNQIKNVIKG